MSWVERSNKFVNRYKAGGRDLRLEVEHASIGSTSSWYWRIVSEEETILRSGRRDSPGQAKSSCTRAAKSYVRNWRGESGHTVKVYSQEKRRQLFGKGFGDGAKMSAMRYIDSDDYMEGWRRGLEARRAAVQQYMKEHKLPPPSILRIN